VYNRVTFEVTGTSWKFVTSSFGVVHVRQSHFNFGKVARTEKETKHVTTTPLVIMGLSYTCLLMLHQQNEYRVLYEESDGSRKEAPSSGNRLKEFFFPDSISQYIADIVVESLKFLFVLFCIHKVSSRKHTINV
jgi:hypothetical protein